jgi:hypothetical protein
MTRRARQTPRVDIATADAAAEVISHAVECVSTLIAAFPEHPVSEATISVYARSLCDLAPDVLDRAIARCLATCDRFPRIAQIRKAAIEEGDRFPGSDEAWGEVESAFGKYGRNRRPQWSHWIIAEAVRRIGWSRLCESDQSDVIRGQFRRAYEELLERTRSDVMARPVVESTKFLPLAARLAEQLAAPEARPLLTEGEDEDDGEGE